MSARVPSDDPAFRALRQHYGHGRRRPVIRRLADGFRNVIRCYNEWTYRINTLQGADHINADRIGRLEWTRTVD